jgi:hypothetical protein
MDPSDERGRIGASVIDAFDLVRRRLDRPSGGLARFGGAVAIASGVPSAFFNPVAVLEAAETGPDVGAAIDWIRGRGLPASVQVRQDFVEPLAAGIEAKGLVRDPWATPVMALAPIPPEPKGPPGVELRTGQAELFDDYHAALESSSRFREVFNHALIEDPEVRVAVGYLDGAPVSAATVIRSGATLGVYTVWTQERARRRGIGGAVTWAAIAAGTSAWPVTLAGLEASEMGEPVYASMGFRTVTRYVAFVPPPESPPGS